MSEITLDETKLKELHKAAIFELLKEQKEVFSEILTEALEDISCSTFKLHYLWLRPHAVTGSSNKFK